MTDMLRSGLVDKLSCEFFAKSVGRLVFKFCSLFAVGCVSFLAGLGFLGWGVGIHTSNPEESYEHFAWVPAAASVLSGTVLLLVVAAVVFTANRICRQYPARDTLSYGRSAVYELFMAEVGMVGEQVTLACGYVSSPRWHSHCGRVESL